MPRPFAYRAALLIAPLLAPTALAAQVAQDQADPTIVERALPALDQRAAPPRLPYDLRFDEAPVEATVPGGGVTASAIEVEDADAVPRADLLAATAPYVGRRLNQQDLRELARGVADVARARGLVFATAWVPEQPLTNGVLRVTLDQGRVHAIRSMGDANPAADRLLAKALVTGRPVTKAELERAVLLVGDMPGVRVKETRFVRENGFGIVLVTLELDRAAAYGQVDNRGSSAIGPIRSTALASVRGVATSGDELGVVVSQTPLQPREFVFVRGRYSAPIAADGSTLGVSASFGRSQPGGRVGQLRLVGHSVDAVVTYSNPLLRSRVKNLNSVIELRGVVSDQALGGVEVRKDKLVTATGALNGSMVRRAGCCAVRPR
jgi:hemolysin activation/secretion protein